MCVCVCVCERERWQTSSINVDARYKGTKSSQNEGAYVSVVGALGDGGGGVDCSFTSLRSSPTR